MTISESPCRRAFWINWDETLGPQLEGNAFIHDNSGDVFESGAPADSFIGRCRVWSFDVDEKRCLDFDGKINDAQLVRDQNDSQYEYLQVINANRLFLAEENSEGEEYSTRSGASRRSILSFSSLQSSSAFSAIILSKPKEEEEEIGPEDAKMPFTRYSCSVSSASIREILGPIEQNIIEAGLNSQARRNAHSIVSPNCPSAGTSTAVALELRRCPVKEVQIAPKRIHARDTLVVSSSKAPLLLTSRGCAKPMNASWETMEGLPVKKNLWGRLRCRLSMFASQQGKMCPA